MTAKPFPQAAPEPGPSVPTMGFPGSLEALADADLVALTAAGDVEAFSVLYRRHASLMLTMAWRVLGNRQDAEEVLQDSSLHAWKKAGEYEHERSSVVTWLTLITRSRSLDRLRSQRSVNRVETDYGLQEAIAAQPPMTQVMDRERSSRVLAAVQELPATQRRVLELCYYGGFSQQEVAEHAGIPLGTVKSRARLAMKTLRQALGDELGN